MPSPTQEVRVATPPPSQPAPKPVTVGVTNPAALDSATERPPPATEPTPTPKSPPPQVRQPEPIDAQKRKELLLKEQRKLKQSQLTKHTFSGAPAYVAVTPPAKSQHMGLGPQPTSAPPTASVPASAPAQASAPATTSTGTVALMQQSLNVVRLPPGSTLTPRQGLLLSAHQLESSLGWEALPMHTLSGNSFGSDKQFAMD